MKFFIFLLSVVSVIVYPFLIHLGVDHVSPRLLAVLFMAAVFVRLCFVARSGALKLKPFIPFFIIGVVSSSVVLISDNALILLHIPTFVNLALSLFFLRSYFYPPTTIENFARLDFPIMPDNAIAYCSKVTLVWSFSFLVCAGLCFVFATFGPRYFWLVWSSVGIYGYHGLVFGVEYLIRRRKIPEFDKAIEAMKAVEKGECV